MATESSTGYERRGALVDRTTQQWVRATGRRVALEECPWLEGPVGGVGVVGTLRAIKEDIRGYADSRGQLRADHNLQLWGATFLRLHYRMRRRTP